MMMRRKRTKEINANTDGDDYDDVYRMTTYDQFEHIRIVQVFSSAA